MNINPADSDVSHRLPQFLKAHLPIAESLGVSLHSYTASSLALQVPLQPNINDKATVYGGSLYCACLMACWGTVYLKAIEHGIEEPNIVVTQGEIKYYGPVDNDFIATCDIENAEEFEGFVQKFLDTGKSKISLHSYVHINGKDAVKFSGSYALIR